MTESPPLFDTNETKLDDLEDDDEDIFASAVQVSPSERSIAPGIEIARGEEKKKDYNPDAYRDAARVICVRSHNYTIRRVSSAPVRRRKLNSSKLHWFQFA